MHSYTFAFGMGGGWGYMDLRYMTGEDGLDEDRVRVRGGGEWPCCEEYN